MSRHIQPAPRGFRWADAPLGRAIMTVFAIVSLLLSLYVGYRYVGLIDCLRDRAVADGVRTKRIADATDLERRADLALLSSPGRPVGTSRAELLARAVAARQHTDRVRAANPAPAGIEAACH
jgi:hypothetical protein